ncbi:hypothetical protein HDU87_002671 [Geranomyces variabilis]|uniref:Uncharacterized protein n=1 Tax=Geranomyces variabilis TaxID=109894 RepID=A0AAD5XTW9_9FUNG|nr:hypothetical protein HDU87_002671 [Geranomyces variabilis]
MTSKQEGEPSGANLQIHRTAELTNEEIHDQHAADISNQNDDASHTDLAQLNYQDRASAEKIISGHRRQRITVGLLRHYRTHRKPFISRPRVNPLSPLWRVTDPHGDPAAGAAMSAGPGVATAVITDAIYALSLARTVLPLAGTAFTTSALVRFVLVFVPLHTAYTQLILDHDRHFATHDLFHLIYTGARISLFFACGAVAPMVFNQFDATWIAFAGLMVIARAAHALVQIVAGAGTRRDAERAWWLISFRACGSLIPCVLWGTIMAMGGVAVRTRDAVWIAAVVVDQACVLGLGFAESGMERKAMRTSAAFGPGGLRFGAAAERAAFAWRTSLLTTLVLASGIPGLFETRAGVGNVDGVLAIPLYARSLLCAIVGVMIVFALERLYAPVSGNNVNATAATTTNLTLPTDAVSAHRGVAPAPTADPAMHTPPPRPLPHTTALFLHSHLHLPLLGFALITLASLAAFLQSMYASIRDQPILDYTPPPNPPSFTAATIAQASSPIAKLYLATGYYSTDTPYAQALFQRNPVAGGSSTIIQPDTWPPQRVFSVSAGLFLFVTALMGLLLASGRAGGGGRWRVAALAFLARVGLAAAVALPGALSAGPQTTLFVLGALLAVTGLASHALIPSSSGLYGQSQSWTNL